MDINCNIVSFCCDAKNLYFLTTEQHNEIY